MTATRRSFRREPPDQRKNALIMATLRLMARSGPAATTVRAIAEEAGISQGMIRHYFTTKEDLISAAYEYHMQTLTEITAATGTRAVTDADRLRAFVVASLTTPVIDPDAVSVWAGFIHMVRRDAAMQETHARTYYHYRDRLETLIAAALNEAGKPPDAAHLRHLAIASNAVIDGLWLEGGMLPTAFGTGELARIGLNSVAAITGLEFIKDREQA